MASINELIKITNGGVYIAPFTDIRSAIIERYRAIYGSDIDLSTGSADGVFVNDLALIINNILQTINTMYANLDVDSASGVYLDILCALSNVTRKPATKSNVYLTLTYSGDSQITLTAQDLVFVDKSGLEWSAQQEQIFNPGETVSVQVFCEQEGAIQAPAGWIYQLIDASLPITVSQPDPANVGNNAEMDGELRARRAQSSGANGVTTLGALTGALLNIVGIDDVKVVNNNTGSAVSLSDGSTNAAHSVYVVLRYDDGIVIPDSTIGKIIYEKLTPGIATSQCTASSGTAKSYIYVAEVNDVYQNIQNQNVYWKQAVPINPTVTLTINVKDFFSTDEFESIANSLMMYMNRLPINQALTANDLMVQSVYADPTFKGQATYTVTSVSASSYVNNLTYYKYTRYSVPQSGSVYVDGQSSPTTTITMGQFTISSVDFKLYNNCVVDENDIVYPLDSQNRFVYNSTTYKIVTTGYPQAVPTQYIITIE